MSYGEMYFAIYGILLIAIVLLIFGMMVGKIWTEHTKDKFNKELKRILINAYMEPEPLKNFYFKHKASLQGMNLFKTELTVFRDQFECKFENSPRKDYNQCIICFSDLENEDKCIGFPGCGHNYHFDCLNEWLSNAKKTKCPICKAEFRDGFADDLCKKMEKSFMRVSEDQ